MHRLWRGAVPLLAAALGFARPASAQTLPAADPAPTAFAETDDAPVQPRVVPHRRIVLEPLKEPAESQPTTDLVVPATAATPRSMVGLLAPNSMPPGWWSKTMPLRVPVVPSGLPGATAPAVVSAPHQAAAGSVMVAPAVRPALAPMAMSAPAAHAWPAAFLVQKEAEATEIRQAAHFESSAHPAAAEKPVAAEVKRRIEAMYGAKAADVAVETAPDGDVVVLVRVRAANLDVENAKLLEWMKAAGPGVHVLLDVTP